MTFLGGPGLEGFGRGWISNLRYRSSSKDCEVIVVGLVDFRKPPCGLSDLLIALASAKLRAQKSLGTHVRTLAVQ